MKEPDAVWQQMTIRQLSAGADHRCNPKLDLVPIRHPLDANIRQSHPDLFSLAHLQRNAFIDDRGVALRSFKGIAQKLGGIKDVIEQTNLTKIKIARKVESEKIVMQGIRDMLNKFDLTCHREANVIIFDLPARHASRMNTVEALRYE